ncbi:DNA helicase, partial [mine drainage metagenome]
GPPGTGKSHTIANLVAHFLAHGQRVLVTAEKEQALKVLLEKIPEEIRDLCVAVLGDDAQGRQRLRDSVTKIAGVATNTADFKEIERLESQLESVGEELAQTINRLRRAREVEVVTLPFPSPLGEGQPWTPSAAAVWVEDNKQACVGIPDELDAEAQPPLSDAEFNELCRLLSEISATDRIDASKFLPT